MTALPIITKYHIAGDHVMATYFEFSFAGSLRCGLLPLRQQAESAKSTVSAE